MRIKIQLSSQNIGYLLIFLILVPPILQYVESASLIFTCLNVAKIAIGAYFFFVGVRQYSNRFFLISLIYVLYILMITIGLAYSIIFARYIGAYIKGEIAFISSVIQTGSVIMTIGIHHAYPYFRKNAIDKETYRQEFASTSFVFYLFYLGLGLIVYCISTFIYPIKYMLIIILLMILWSYNRVLGYIVLVETPNKRNRVGVIFSSIELVITIILFIFTEATFGFGIFCTALAQILEFLFYTYLLRDDIRFSRFSWKHLIEIIKYGFFPMIALVMNTINYRIDVFMLKGFSTVSMSEIGIYSVGIALAEKVLLIPDSLQEILLSKLAKEKGPNEVAMVCRITLPICIGVAMAIAILGKPFLDILYGSGYNGAYSVTVISVGGISCMVFYKMISQYNIVYHKQVKNVILLSVAVLVNVILNTIFVPLFGINGAAIATCIGNAVCSLLFILTFSYDTGISLHNIVLLNSSDKKIVFDIFRKKTNY